MRIIQIICSCTWLRKVTFITTLIELIGKGKIM